MKTAARLLRPYLFPYRAPFALALAAMIGEIATALLMPVPIQRAVDLLVSAFRHAGPHARTATLSTSQLEQLLVLTAALLMIALLDALFTYVDSSNSARVGQRVVTELRRSLFSHIQRLSLSFHRSTGTRSGDLQLRLSGDVANLQVLLSSVVSGLVTNAGTAALMLGALLVLDRRLGAIVVVGSIPVYLLSRHYRIKIRSAVRAARKQDGQISAMLAETLSAAPLVQVLGREQHEAERLLDATEEGLVYGIQASEAQARVQPAVTLVTSAVIALTMLVAALLVVRGSLSIGLLTLALAYTRGTFSSMRQLARLPIQVQRAAVSAERLAEVFALAPDVSDPVRPQPIPPAPLDVRFDSVTFGYTPGHPVLKDFSWLIESGSVVALVGSTGAGKSTALALVPRLYDVWEGAVRLGGRDVREVSLADLRASVTLVLQESLLFRNTLWNNIAYGRPDATKEDVMVAAEAAGVLTFVDELDDGFETIVSERGSTLSGGQKQCVALARAMLRRAPIVIMDEPTSSMDAATERLVIRGIGRLIEGRTAIVIAHRISTIRGADNVAVMENGHLVQSGPPSELLKQDGLLRQLSLLQSGRTAG